MNCDLHHHIPQIWNKLVTEKKKTNEENNIISQQKNILHPKSLSQVVEK